MPKGTTGYNTYCQTSYIHLQCYWLFLIENKNLKSSDLKTKGIEVPEFSWKKISLLYGFIVHHT